MTVGNVSAIRRQDVIHAWHFGEPGSGGHRNRCGHPFTADHGVTSHGPQVTCPVCLERMTEVEKINGEAGR